VKTQAAIVLLAVLVGVVLGLGVYTFVYARGYSYLSNNPESCTNCHVMRDYYSAWLKSSHRSVAVCNDCHTPHQTLGKYATKATNGFLHSLAFTSGNFPDAIQIKPRNRRVTEGACRSCHREITSALVAPQGSAEIECVRCHFNVGHSAASYVVANP